jgi:hypothetical protein
MTGCLELANVEYDSELMKGLTSRGFDWANPVL